MRTPVDTRAGKGAPPSSPLLEVANAFEDMKRSEVQRVLGRRVLASICGTDPARYLATEVFVLEPGS